MSEGRDGVFVQGWMWVDWDKGDSPMDDDAAIKLAREQWHSNPGWLAIDGGAVVAWRDDQLSEANRAAIVTAELKRRERVRNAMAITIKPFLDRCDTEHSREVANLALTVVGEAEAGKPPSKYLRSLAADGGMTKEVARADAPVEDFAAVVRREVESIRDYIRQITREAKEAHERDRRAFMEAMGTPASADLKPGRWPEPLPTDAECAQVKEAVDAAMAEESLTEQMAPTPDHSASAGE